MIAFAVLLVVSTKSKRWHRVIFSLLLGLAVFIQFGAIVGYVIFPSFVDHAEVSVLLLSQNASIGHVDFYEYRNGFPYPIGNYGPLSFIIQNVGTQFLGNSIWVAKVPATVASLSTLFLLVFGVKNKIFSPFTLFLLPIFGMHTFWIRPDTYILLIIVSMIIISKKQRLTVNRKFFILGLLTGFLALLKLSALLYGVLILIFALKIGRKQIQPFRTLCEFVFGTLFSSGFLFLLYPFSIRDHLYFLGWTTGPGFPVNSILMLTVFLISYVLAISFPNHRFGIPKWTPNYLSILFSISIALPILSLIIIASKPGAGAHHLLPALILIASSYWCKDTVINLRTIMIASLMLVIGLYGNLQLFKSYVNEWKITNQSFDELQEIEKSFPNFSVFPSSLEAYDQTFLRAEFEKSNFIDIAGLMENQFSQKYNGDLLQKFRYCYFPIIVTPLQGDPLSIKNFYGGTKLFDKETVSAFGENYAIAKQFTHWKVFACQPEID